MKKKTKELHINVTDEDYQQGLAQGIAEEALLKPGRHVFKRGGFRERHPDFKRSGIESRNVKVRVIMHLDLDVLNYFKERATQPNAAPYETQINRELRAIVEHQTNRASQTRYGQFISLTGMVLSPTARKRTVTSKRANRYLQELTNSLSASLSK